MLIVQMVFGIIVGPFEGWPWGDSLYFSFITGPTIGYGDFVPRSEFGCFLSILIGIGVILLTGLVAAIGVKALNAVAEIDHCKPHDRQGRNASTC